jgi:hypothetical protein
VRGASFLLEHILVFINEEVSKENTGAINLRENFINTLGHITWRVNHAITKPVLN